MYKKENPWCNYVYVLFLFLGSNFSQHIVHSVRHLCDQSEIMEQAFARLNVQFLCVCVPGAG